MSKVKAEDPREALIACVERIREETPPKPPPEPDDGLGPDGIDMDEMLHAMQSRLMSTAALEQRVAQLETSYRLITHTLGMMSPRPFPPGPMVFNNTGDERPPK